jgi:membrane protease YdiL (CAAX protease family)
MNVEENSKPDRIWHYLILPPIILNVGGIVLIGAFYAYFYAQAQNGTPSSIPSLSAGQLQFLISSFVFVVELALAITLYARLRKTNFPIKSLFFSSGFPWKFRRLPALLLFVVSNGIFAVYIWWLIKHSPGLSYAGLQLWQGIFMVTLVPLTAAFTEELIWRGYILTGLRQRGRSPWQAILISAISFSLIHGVFLPDKLLVTFVLGLLMGYYYLREKNLIPLIISHLVIDVWSFSIFFFLR